ncbi:MAG: transcription termination factor NusA [Pseudanabaenaceae cyanobacterium]|jgi:N utilization substance protein A
MALLSLPNLGSMVDVISKERNLPRHAVHSALREALLKGYEKFRKTYRSDGNNFEDEHFSNFDVELDVKNEGFRVLATKTIVDQVNDPDHEIGLAEVQEVAPEAQAGGTVVVDVTPEQGDFGRMAAIQTKQVLAQKLRDQQRRMIQEEFQDMEGVVLQGRVIRFENSSVIMAVSSGYGQPEVEAELPPKEQLPNELPYKPNSTLKVYLKTVYQNPRKGPQLMVSRADAGLVVHLFANEVPEIEDDIVRIVAVAREASPRPNAPHVGPRTKIAVDTMERDVDPVGACIGARGARIQAVVAELHGEKIDVIRWSPDPATYIANALSPAKIQEVRLMNAEERQTHVLVADDQLSLAIGKEGQNVRLAAKLTGWKIDIKSASRYDREAEDLKVAEERRARAEAEQVRLRNAALKQAEEERLAAEAAAELAEAEAAEQEEEALTDTDEAVASDSASDGVEAAAEIIETEISDEEENTVDSSVASDEADPDQAEESEPVAITDEASLATATAES